MDSRYVLLEKHSQTDIEKKGLERFWSYFCTFFAMKCVLKSSSLLLPCCYLFCADTMVRLFVIVVMFFLSVLFVTKWFNTSCVKLAFCFQDQYFVIDYTGFKIASSYGKLLLFFVDYTFHCQCSSYHRHSWPAWGNKSSTSYSSTHSRNLRLEEFSIQLVLLRSLCLSVFVPFKHY
jgi:hypothetical protein